MMKPNLQVITDKTPPTKPETSTAREVLRGLLEQRAQGERRIKDLEAAIGRLLVPSDAVARAADALQQFNATSEAAFVAWSKNSLRKEPPPIIDTQTKVRLLAELAQARDNATAAEGARSKLNSEANAEAVALKALQVPIDTAIAQIVSETAISLLDDLGQAVQVAIAKQRRLKDAVTMVFAIGNASGQNIINHDAEMLDAALKAAAVPEVPEMASPWPAFVAALRTDAAAEFFKS